MPLSSCTVKRPAPRKAFILAAGFGTRMLPLSRDLPKPLMPIWGRPVLAHVLLMLRRWGVRDVVINLHHQPSEILELARLHPVPGLRVSLSFEPSILGTGGALRRAQWFPGADPFWLINADVAADLDPRPLAERHASGRYLATLWMDRDRGPRTVEMRRGLITDFASAHRGARGTYTFCGLHLLSPRILDYLPADGFSGIISAYQSAMRHGERIAGVCLPRSYWADIGAPYQYVETHRQVRDAHRSKRPGARLFNPGAEEPARAARRGGAVVKGFASIGRNVRIERGAILEDCVVWDNASLGPAAQVRRAIVGRGTAVSEPVEYLAMRADQALDAEERIALEEIGWDVRKATALPLGPRGSDRAFTRISRPRESVMLMHYGTDRMENELYCGHASVLAGIGFPVPAVLLYRPGPHLAILEDVGRTCLQDVVKDSSDSRTLALYRKVLDSVLLLHRKGLRAAKAARVRLMPPFAPPLYRRERQLFAREFLAGRLGLGDRATRAVLRDLERVARRLLRAEPVLVHRDLQSSNIFLRGSRPVFIDFQGMRVGPATYDLASLLCDPYVCLPRQMQETLLEYYASKSPDPAAVRGLFWWAAVQRLAQALGAFARLSGIPGMHAFSGHIKPGLVMLSRAVQQTGGLDALAEVVVEALDGRFCDRLIPGTQLTR
jgi:N-acetylmuramate 1-kinase